MSFRGTLESSNCLCFKAEQLSQRRDSLYARRLVELRQRANRCLEFAVGI